MNFARFVICSLLLYRRALFSEGSFLREKTSPNGDNMLLKLLMIFVPGLQMSGPWDVIVIGASEDQIDETKPILQAFPFIVGKKLKGICTSRAVKPTTFIIHFLASLESEYITKVMESLASCGRNVRMFVFEGMEVSDHDVEHVFYIALEKIALVPIFMHHMKKSVRLYSYKMTAGCSGKAEMFVDWVPGGNLDWLAEVLSASMGSGCSITVGTMHRPPWMHLAKDENGTVKILEGSEADLISTIVKKMNFTFHVEEFRFSGSKNTNKEHPTVPSCATRSSDICIGHIRPHGKLVEVDTSQNYAHECIVWCIPKITHEKSNFLTSEFPWSIWLLIGLTFLTSFAVERVVRNSHPLNQENANRSERCVIILDLIGSTLGNPIIYEPLSIGSKFLLISYLTYSTVITTAYKTSLSSMLTIDNSVASIDNVKEIIRANLTTGGDWFKLRILEDQRGESELIPELLRRFVIEPNITKALLRVSNDQDFAYLTSLTELNYHKHLLSQAGKSVSVHVQNKCWLIHGAVMVFPKSSPYIDPINNIMSRLASDGLLLHWMTKYSKPDQLNSNRAKSSEIMNTLEGLRRFTRVKFYKIFRLYCLALIFCASIFLWEPVASKFKFSGRER